MRPLYAILLSYTIGFALFPPRVFLVGDEERYVSQAVAFSHGALSLGTQWVEPASRLQVDSDYPAGTSLLETPFVWLLGWRAAALASVLGLIVATLATAWWLRDEDHPPGFALL